MFELVPLPPFGHFGRGAGDRAGEVRGQQPERAVHLGRDLLDLPERVHELGRHRLARHGEVLDRALRLRSVQRRHGHLHLAETVLLPAELRHGGLRIFGGR
jgi:hypothetical protein